MYVFGVAVCAKKSKRGVSPTPPSPTVAVVSAYVFGRRLCIIKKSEKGGGKSKVASLSPPPSPLVAAMRALCNKKK